MAPARGKRLAVLGAAFVAFASGVLLPFVADSGESAIAWISLASAFTGLFALFAWIQFDRRERGLARSAGFNLALSCFTVVAAPVYFVRHRERGRRWQPVLGFFLAFTVGWNALLMGGIVAGSLLRALVSPATA
jgi:hypothetical protein